MKEFTVRISENTVWEDCFVACIGYFDGLHRGHQQLIKKGRMISEEKGVKLALISFDPDPWITLGIKKNVKHLTTIIDRKILAQQFGVEYWITLDFTKEMAELSPPEFITLLNNMPLTDLVCGFDFTYGSKGEGNIESLKIAYRSFDLHVVEEVCEDGEKISTTRISALIEDGEVENAGILLGHPFKIQGFVVHGKQLGRRIGFPTANIDYSNEYLLPKIGVYAGQIIVEGDSHLAMINIGYNPTVNTEQTLFLEANILDYDKMIYGEQVSVQFCKRIRDEIKFDSLAELSQQLLADQQFTRRYFNHG